VAFPHLSKEAATQIRLVIDDYFVFLGEQVASRLNRHLREKVEDFCCFSCFHVKVRFAEGVVGAETAGFSGEQTATLRDQLGYHALVHAIFAEFAQKLSQLYQFYAVEIGELLKHIYDFLLFDLVVDLE